jgi:predicted DNA-binding transcriptional regulator YafY
MYSPTSRLLAVLSLLQAYHHISGVEIARRLEVDTRTVRRYITILQDMGIPVETERGPHGGYQLQRGYKLPPMMFTDAEAVALTLGLIAIREFSFPVDLAAVESALAKTERVMPENLYQQTRGLREAIAFNVNSYLSPPQMAAYKNDVLVRLSTSVQQNRRVLLRYRAWQSDESERHFDPYGVVYNVGYWYVTGYCHLRNDLRTFRVDRVSRVELLADGFERPVDFDALDYVLRSIASWPEAEQIEVLIEAPLEQVQEFISPVMGTLEESEQGVILRRAAVQLEWIVPVLLNIDAPMQVIQTDELRQLIHQMGRRALNMAGKNPGADQ